MTDAQSHTIAPPFSMDKFLDATQYNPSDYELRYRSKTASYNYMHFGAHAPTQLYKASVLDIVHGPTNEHVMLKFANENCKLVGVSAFQDLRDVSLQRFDPVPGSRAQQNVRYSRIRSESILCHETEFDTAGELIDQGYRPVSKTVFPNLYYDFIDTRQLMMTLTHVLTHPDTAQLAERDIRRVQLPIVMALLNHNIQDATLSTGTVGLSTPPVISAAEYQYA